VNLDESAEMLLGKQVPVVDEYSPELLYPIPRERARHTLRIGATLPFHGCDLWHAYEMSWLDARGKPQVRVGRFTIPADSPNMVESKSFKLYLNSLNSTRFGAEDELLALMQADLACATGAEVGIELLGLDAPELDGRPLAGVCLDALEEDIPEESPSTALLRCWDDLVEETLYSHLLRSLCPVTGQPDWASVSIRYRGRAIDRAGLLRYIIAFRRHQEFHEQCVERMFMDISKAAQPDMLEIQACYTRRGGLDINPIRSTEPEPVPLPRLNRQ